MDQQQQQLIDRIKQAQNILVTVSSNPSVDQLSAAIGLTLVLNKLDKHGTAVFSGEVPSTIDFLKPEDTLEKNTDSLRDFIIALDKSKADKLRYKVEDEVVRIFITPYRTSLSEKDLQFSQGDFNVDVVVALGVTEQQDLDAAIIAHGRILHDATVVSVSTVGQGSLGSINWVDPSASSLSEMMVGLTDGLDKKAMDGQIATALLTGIVATTDRFRNEKTSPKTMSASAELMAAGANQQLIATELETTAGPAPEGPQTTEAPAAPSSSDEPQTPKKEPGTLEIDHESTEEPEQTEPEPPAEQPGPQVHVDNDGHLVTEDETMPEISGVRGVGSDGTPTESPARPTVKRERMAEPPQLADGDLTANTTPEPLDPSTEELTLPKVESPLLTHNENVLPQAPTPEPPEPAAPFIPQAPLTPPPADWQAPAAASPPPPVAPDETLTEIEEQVHSPHLQAQDAPAPGAPAQAAGPASSVDQARNAVEAALQGTPGNDPLQPISALNAQPFGSELHAAGAFEQPAAPNPVPNTGFSEPTPGTSPADETLDMPLPSSPFGAAQPAPAAVPSSAPPSAFPGAPQQGSTPGGQTSPPPVPPPMIPPLQ